MQKNLYSVRDEKTVAFFPPFLASNHGEALRTFSDLCKNVDTLMARYPGDFALYHLATFDDQSGSVVGLSLPVQIGSASEYVAQPVNLSAVK